MQNLHDLISRQAQNGALTWIGLRPSRRLPLLSVPRAEITATGLEGDHGSSEKRAVTLIQAEHVPVISAVLGGVSVHFSDLRRNLVVEGINLAGLRGRRIEIGETILEVVGICAPCSRMEETFGFGGYAAVRGHGGWCARVIRPGFVNVGDAVVPC